MSDEKHKLAAGSEEGWLTTLIPIAIAVVVAVSSTMLTQKLTGGYASSSPPVNVLVFSFEDWLEKVPENASADEMDAVFVEARKAADKAAEAGFVVIERGQAVAFPEAARLTPGMFNSSASDGEG